MMTLLVFASLIWGAVWLWPSPIPLVHRDELTKDLEVPQLMSGRRVSFGCSVIFDADQWEYFTDEGKFRRRMREIRRELRNQRLFCQFKWCSALMLLFVSGCTMLKYVLL